MYCSNKIDSMFISVAPKAVTAAVFSLAIGTFLAALFLNLVLITGLADGLHPNYYYELFTRIALVVVLLMIATFIIRTFEIPKRSEYGLPVKIMLLVYGLGVLAALLDPFNPIRSEPNFIRYPTSVVLGTAGAFLFYAALSPQRHLVLRVLSVGLGALLITAGIDEIWQLHERMTAANDTLIKEKTGIGSQDLVTLVVAVVGSLVALIARRIVRAFAVRGVLGIGGREVAASDLFLAAGVVFLAAMMLDTFDVVFSSLAHTVFSIFLPENHSLFAGESLKGYVEALANSIEELLEYAAAVLLLSTAIVFHFDKR